LNRSFEAFLNPNSVALIGASTKEGTIAQRVLENVGKARIPRVFPVNPHAGEILGHRCYRGLADLPEVPDLAIVVTPPAAVPQVLRECAARGVPAVMVCTSGFREAGEQGARLQAEIEDVVRETGLALIGPNCLGVYNVSDGRNLTIAASFSGIGVEARPGPVAFVTQSGAYAIGLFLVGMESGVRFSRVVTLGNKAGLDDADLLAWLADDPQTRVILLYTEDLRDGRRFYRVAREVARRKPVAVFKVGKTDAGARAAASHTGALAGSYRVQRAAFAQAGLIEASSSRALLEVGKVLATQPPLRGRRLGIITNSGGQASEVADLCGRFGFEVPPLSAALQERLVAASAVPAWGSPRNPVDLGAGNVHYPAYYTESARLLLQSDEVDAALLLMVGVGLEWPVERFCAAAPELLGYGKPLLIVGTSHRAAVERCRTRYQEAGVPVVEDAGLGVECLAALRRWGESRCGC
jgi:acyl-CoA synthetase (NDP forming)